MSTRRGALVQGISECVPPSYQRHIRWFLLFYRVVKSCLSLHIQVPSLSVVQVPNPSSDLHLLLLVLFSNLHGGPSSTATSPPSVHFLGHLSAGSLTKRNHSRREKISERSPEITAPRNQRPSVQGLRSQSVSPIHHLLQKTKLLLPGYSD